MSEHSPPSPTPEDVADAVEVYRHEHAGAGGADRVVVYRHRAGDYIHRAWGVDPDHGEYDRIRWVPGEKGPSLIEGLREADQRLYPETAPITAGNLPGIVGFGLLVLALVAGVVVFLARIVARAG